MSNKDGIRPSNGPRSELETTRNPAPFDPLLLDKAVIAIPLLREIRREGEEKKQLKAARGRLRPNRGEEVIGLDLNPHYPGGVLAAREAVEGWVEQRKGLTTRPEKNSPVRERCIFAKLRGPALDVLHAHKPRAALDEPLPFVRTWWTFPRSHAVIIDLNLEYPQGRKGARRVVLQEIDRLKKSDSRKSKTRNNADSEPDDEDSQYVFADLTSDMIIELVKTDSGDPTERPRAIYRIWPDFPVQMLLTKSCSTVKADAARNAFSTWGENITWAVVDSGVEADHVHFQKDDNFGRTKKPLLPGEFHRDFTAKVKKGNALADAQGHGTHVAGIIAGGISADEGGKRSAVSRFFTEKGSQDFRAAKLTNGISGIAPKCRLVSLKVLDDFGNGTVSNLISALQHVQQINGYGRRLLIHGVNISLGYTFEPEWFACGQSPVCVEVDRLVKSGVVVVVAAGNTGYGSVQTEFVGVKPAGLDITINDPGNAELAITVGSTHRDMPHTYGVSYFSSKGPTGDGRAKPDLVAPGEKIISCACGALKEQGAGNRNCDYVETSGTSMAAPHVSGVIAAFLSVRREFIGKPEKVKEIFLAAATDLRRDKYFQGAGLVDLMRAIQSV